MKTNRRLFSPDDAKNIVKKVLFLSSAGTLAFCAISSSPHWMLRLAISAAALLAMVYELSRSAPVGYEDQKGFHYVRVRRPRRRAGRSTIGSLLSPARRTANA